VSPDDRTIPISRGLFGSRRSATAGSSALPRGRQERDALGRARLDLGFNIASVALIAFLFAIMVIRASDYPDLALSLAAWGVLFVTLVAALVLRFRLPELLPNWLFAVALVLWAAVVALDILGTATPTAWVPLTAAAAVGPALLLCVPVRPARDVVVASAALGAVLATVLVVRSLGDLQMLGPGIATVAVAIAPPLVGLQIVRSLSTLVQLELDLVQVQSTVSSPGYAVGMMASEELARLDLAAERLLDGVATGRTALPLDEATADAAASIATELRLHLIQGRKETWLYHAVTESALLGPTVTLTDPDGLAAGLTRDQRDGLLTAVWLLISDPVRSGAGQARTLSLDIVRASGPHVAAGSAVASGATMAIVITTTGVPRNGVDPAAWQAIRKVGRHAESYSDSALRIEITTVSDTTAELT
jgi:predicted aspartyl protease